MKGLLKNIFSIEKTKNQTIARILGFKFKKGITDGIDYAIMRSLSSNIGDEIQWIAALRFMPEKVKLICAENQGEYKTKRRTKVIKNGWYTHYPKKFLTGKNIEPLLISMYIHTSCYKYFSKNKKVIEYFKKYSPVGCRDLATLRFLQSLNIPAYFSACLTLTLVPNPEIKKQNYILALGLNKEQEAYLRKCTKKRVLAFDTLAPLGLRTQDRYELAKIYLALYQSAFCIVTNRLHAALPSLALNTPVLLINIDKNNLKKDPERFDGLREFLNNVNSEDFLKGNFDYDFDNPPLNPSKYKKYADDLIKRCSLFTGYNNEDTIIPDYDVIDKILKYFSRSNKSNVRYLYKASFREISSVFFNKLFKLKDYYDIKDDSKTYLVNEKLNINNCKVQSRERERVIHLEIYKNKLRKVI